MTGPGNSRGRGRIPIPTRPWGHVSLDAPGVYPRATREGVSEGGGRSMRAPPFFSWARDERRPPHGGCDGRSRRAWIIGPAGLLVAGVGGRRGRPAHHGGRGRGRAGGAARARVLH